MHNIKVYGEEGTDLWLHSLLNQAIVKVSDHFHAPSVLVKGKGPSYTLTCRLDMIRSMSRRHGGEKLCCPCWYKNSGPSRL